MVLMLTGSRGATWAAAVRAVKYFPFYLHPGDVVIHGGAQGADRFLAQAVSQRFYETHGTSVHVEVFEPEWKKYGKQAGLFRNATMADKASACLALWDGKSRGTQNAVQHCTKRGVPVWLASTVAADGVSLDGIRAV